MKLDDKDFVYAFQTDGVQEGEEQINALVQAALDAGVISDTSSASIQKLANMLVELGIISGEPVEGLESTTNAVENLKSALSDLPGYAGESTDSLIKFKISYWINSR